jgi:hypothetical protein
MESGVVGSTHIFDSSVLARRAAPVANAVLAPSTKEAAVVIAETLKRMCALAGCEPGGFYRFPTGPPMADLWKLGEGVTLSGFEEDARRETFTCDQTSHTPTDRAGRASGLVLFG